MCFLQYSNCLNIVVEDLLQSFSAEDKDASGVISYQIIKKVLQAKSWDGLGLTSFHIATILSSVPQNDQDEVSVEYNPS